MTFFNAIFGGFDILVKNIKQLLLPLLSFSFVLTIIYYMFGQDIFCINTEYMQSHYCRNEIMFFALTKLLQAFCLIIFMRIWYHVGLQKNERYSFSILKPQKSDFKTIGLFLLLFATIAISLFGVYLLAIREPNPNWRIEAAYFMTVSLLFFVPVFALRFLSWFAFNWENTPIPTIKQTWRQTSNYTMKIFTGIIFFMLFMSALMNMLVRFVSNYDDINNFIIPFLAEYLSAVIMVVMAAVFTNITYIQKQNLFERI